MSTDDEMVENLWPDSFGSLPSEKSPAQILREQGIHLGAMTANIVVGRVCTTVQEPTTRNGTRTFQHTFHLCCSALDSIEVLLLWVEHQTDALYPAIIRDSLGRYEADAANPGELAVALKDLFADPKTMKLIAVIVAQCRA